MRTLTGSFHAHIVPAITSVGSAVPARTVTNKDLEATLATTDDWIRQRTGIERRHLASTEDKTGALAANAAQAALNASRLTAEELDAIIVATSTPDDAIVPTACQVQAALGASRAFAFDLAAACSGFVYACAMAGQWIKSGQVQHALVIGSETFSRLVNWSDRQTAILFGDGAGAVVLSAVPSSSDNWYCHLGADGSGKDLLFAPRGSYLQMKGREVFKFGVRVVTEELERLAAQSGLRLEEIDLWQYLCRFHSHRPGRSRPERATFPGKPCRPRRLRRRLNLGHLPFNLPTAGSRANKRRWERSHLPSFPGKRKYQEVVRICR
ncbi:MAG: 3-oxoacyl-[acyl-carrier-protein] synthase [Bacillota bacterium]|nr:3-oxoacyl-[acyl-carrier-protein] synthase [Bacillota bacterium]